MTAFTFNSAINESVRGISTLTLTVLDGDAVLADAITPGEFIFIGVEEQTPVKFVMSDTGENGVVTGTVCTATTILADNGGAEDTLAGAANVGAIAVGFNQATATQHAFLTELNTAQASAFGSGFFTATLPTEATGSQALVLTKVGQLFSDPGTNDIATVANTHTDAPTSNNLDNSSWESLAGDLDDNADVAAELQARMGTADAAAAGGYDIADDTEYTTKFIPALREFKKKVK